MRLNHLQLPCSDIARSIVFYRVLGLQPIVIENAEDGTPRYARLRTPDGEVTLSLERSATWMSVDDRQPGPAIYFECDDLDERVRALLAAGYAFVTPPEMQPWRWREAQLTDPDGHGIRLYHAGRYRLDPPWRLPDTPGAPDSTTHDADATAATAAHAPAPVAADATTAAISPAPSAEDGISPPPDLAGFLAVHNYGYVDARIPTARDQELAAHLENLIALGPTARDQAASDLGRPYTSTLLTFAERMATHAVRQRRDRPALLGLFAIGLSWRAAADVRAAIPILGVLHDAATRAGADAGRVFDDVQALLPDDVARVFRDFLTRPDLDDIAAEMGYVAGADRDGFRYRRLWGGGLVEPES